MNRILFWCIFVNTAMVFAGVIAMMIGVRWDPVTLIFNATAVAACLFAVWLPGKTE